jgi:hypothetical protein
VFAREDAPLDTSSFIPNEAELEQSLRGSTAGDVVLLVQQCLRVGYAEQAIAICSAAHALGIEDPALSVSEASARFASGDSGGAIALLDDLLRSSPGHLVALFQKALFLARCGDLRQSRQILGAVIDAFPDFPGAHGALASILMPGPPYREVLARIHRLLRPDTYLEIGVEHGGTLALATTASVAAGVDPAELPLEKTLPKGARIYRTKSDDFFAKETMATVFGGKTVDLAFIDGMHWFEYAVRDFAHTERWASNSAVVVLHDCLPVSRTAARRERVSTFWAGDVWKTLACLLDYRSDLVVHVVPTPPSGLVVVRNLDPASKVLEQKSVEIVERYRDMPYPYEPGDWPERYRLVENDEAGLARALGV